MKRSVIPSFMSHIVNFPLILFVGILLMCFSPRLQAANELGLCGDSVEWILEDGVLTISGTGQMDDFKKGKRPWKTAKIKSVIIHEGVANIGSRAFENAYKLTGISMPGSVKSIGDSVFLNCTKLKKIIIPDSVKSIGNACFSGCNKLDSIAMPKQLESVGERAFWGCQEMTDLVLPDAVQKVGGNAFGNCPKLTILIVPDDPFEVVGKDSLLGLENCNILSMVRAHHKLCPEYIKKYIPKACPFMRDGNPRRYYTGSISKGSKTIVPAMKYYTLKEARDSVERIFTRYFLLSNPCQSYDLIEEKISRFIINLERPIYKEVLQFYYDKFYEAGSANQLDQAAQMAFQYVMLGGKEDEELLWDIILTKYGSENATNNMRFLMSKFSEISNMKDSVYKHTIDSITAVYYDVLYPSTMREMCGYWVSVNDTSRDDISANIPDFIFHIADITIPNGTTILSAPKCRWSARKAKGLWQHVSHGKSQLPYSYETGYNQETQTLRLLFSNQSKKIANAKLQHQALDMVQNLEATMSASLEQYQRELNKALAKNLLSFSSWGASSALGFGIGLGVQVVAAAVIFAVIYSSNIEKAESYEVRMTPLAQDVMDVSVVYAFSEHNYNNGKTKYKEDVRNMTFVKCTEADSVVFISKRLQPIFCGEALDANDPILEEFNAKKDKQTCQAINQTNMDKLQKKAEEHLRLKAMEETMEAEQTQEEKDEEDVYFY